MLTICETFNYNHVYVYIYNFAGDYMRHMSSNVIMFSTCWEGRNSYNWYTMTLWWWWYLCHPSKQATNQNRIKMEMWVIRNLLNLIFIINYISCNWLGVSRPIQIDVHQIIALRRRYAGIEISNAHMEIRKLKCIPRLASQEKAIMWAHTKSKLNCDGPAASPKIRMTCQRCSKTRAYKQQAVFLLFTLKLNVNSNDIRRTDARLDRRDKTRWAKSQDNIWILRNFSISW